jgi:hypothetical protein
MGQFCVPQQPLQFFQHFRVSPVRFSGQHISTKVDAQPRKLDFMQPPKSSAHFLAQNVARLAEASPDAKAAAIRNGVKRSTWYTILAEDKSPTLDTLDKLAQTFKADAWLLLHPDMKVWDKNKAWISHLIETYLSADDKGREHIHSAIRLVDERIGRPAPDEFGRAPDERLVEAPPPLKSQPEARPDRAAANGESDFQPDNSTARRLRRKADEAQQGRGPGSNRPMKAGVR